MLASSITYIMQTHAAAQCPFLIELVPCCYIKRHDAREFRDIVTHKDILNLTCLACLVLAVPTDHRHDCVSSERCMRMQ
jgi:hypothetical protein